MIRRMTNTSELVEEESRIDIVDEYAQKLINSEYGIECTRGFIVGGLRGHERLLSLSRDTGNPRWKPLHLAANWNVWKVCSGTTIIQPEGICLPCPI